jgi:hypothetical protein
MAGSQAAPISIVLKKLWKKNDCDVYKKVTCPVCTTSGDEKGPARQHNATNLGEHTGESISTIILMEGGQEINQRNG